MGFMQFLWVFCYSLLLFQQIMGELLTWNRDFLLHVGIQHWMLANYKHNHLMRAVLTKYLHTCMHGSIMISSEPPTGLLPSAGMVKTFVYRIGPAISLILCVLILLSVMVWCQKLGVWLLKVKSFSQLFSITTQYFQRNICIIPIVYPWKGIFVFRKSLMGCSGNAFTE